MKKLILIVLTAVSLFTISAAGQSTLGVVWNSGTGWNTNSTMTYLYVSSNEVSRLSPRITNAPLVTTYTNIPITTNQLYSMFVTGAETNAPTIESDVSNQIRFQLLPYVRGTASKTFTMLSYTNVSWASFQLIQAPTNGVLSGTPPNITYTPTNGTGFNRDRFVYKSPEMAGGTNITYNYGIYFYWFNSAPALRDAFQVN